MNSSGGAELLFGNIRDHSVNIPSQTPDGRPADVTFLIHWIRDNLLKERVELFVENNTVCASTFERCLPRPKMLILSLLLVVLGFLFS